jgi:hypothetical protein
MTSQRSRLYFRDAGRSQSGVAVSLIAMALGAGLWLQPARWHKTPSYGNLLQIASTQAWGTLHLAVGVILMVYLFAYSPRWFAILSHTMAFALFASWWVAFVIRWSTDDKTTVVNVISWATYVALVLLSVLQIDAASYRRSRLDREGP